MVANKSLKDPEDDTVLKLILVYLVVVSLAITSSFFW
jgi:hypothetical protein